MPRQLLNMIFVALIFTLSSKGPAWCQDGQRDSTAERQQRLPEFEQGQVMQAKMGATVELQQLACELEYGSGTVKYNAIKKLGSVGGWFSTHLLIPLLKDEPKYTGSSGDAYGTYVPLQLQALRVLPKIVPNAPIAPDHKVSLVDYSKELDVWKKWLAANEDSLRKLEPTGDGIVVSEKLCHKVLKSDLASTAFPNPNPKHSRPGRPQ